MQLSTPVNITPSPRPMAHLRPVMLIGSCFSDHMAAHFQQEGFDTLANPFGTLYNPESIAVALQRCLDGRMMEPADLVWNESLWHSWLHHTSFSRAEKADCLEACNRQIATASHMLLHRQPDLIVTFGSAFVYRLQNGTTVGNCHKLPPSTFSRQFLTPEQIAELWNPLLQQLQQLHIRVIFTISPIRHVADTPHGNQLSKASLLLSTQLITEPHDYFPAYEIMMDELRDYRFYARDMLHPSDVAVDIIWERFQQMFFTPDTIATGQRFIKQAKQQGHRPIAQRNN